MWQEFMTKIRVCVVSHHINVTGIHSRDNIKNTPRKLLNYKNALIKIKIMRLAAFFSTSINWNRNIKGLYCSLNCELSENIKIITFDAKLTMIFKIIRYGILIWAYIWQRGIFVISEQLRGIFDIIPIFNYYSKYWYPIVMRWWIFRVAFSRSELAKTARDILAVSASGCTMEREFSISGRIAIWQRNRLQIRCYIKAALKRQGAVLWYSTIEENLDVLVPERIDEVP